MPHQLARLRYAKSISDREAEAIFRALADNVNNYDQVTEVCDLRTRCQNIGSSASQLLSWLPPHLHGLQPLSFGLFHQHEVVRDLTVDIFNELRAYPVSIVAFPIWKSHSLATMSRSGFSICKR